MAGYTRPGEVDQLQYEIMNEISRDVPEIARGIFGKQTNLPDMTRVSNQQVDQMYRQAYLRGDRQFLQQEALRDPQQFLDVTDRLGVKDRPVGMDGKPQGPPQGALEQALKANQNAAPPMPQLPSPGIGLGAVPAVPTVAAPAALPAPVPTPPMVGPGAVVPAFAEGGIVDQPTLALVGEAGPEAIVPLGPQQPIDYNAAWAAADAADQQQAAQAAAMADLRSGERGEYPAPAIDPANPKPGEIEAYIRQAAAKRGIDPDVAVAVALHEGGRDPRKPDQPPFTDPAVMAVFPTGRSYWPFQLHYGGAGTPYAAWGGTAGMGNDFTRMTGYQPGDPAAWRPAVDFALDRALQTGWYPNFYGSVPARVSTWQGIPRRTA